MAMTKVSVYPHVERSIVENRHATERPDPTKSLQTCCRYQLSIAESRQQDKAGRCSVFSGRDIQAASTGWSPEYTYTRIRQCASRIKEYLGR